MSNVESYTVVMLLTVILIIIITNPSPPHSFIPRLKPSFSAMLPTATFLFCFRSEYTDSSDCLLLGPTSEHICFFLLFSFSVLHFLFVVSVR